MPAQLFDIVSREKPNPAQPAAIGDFGLAAAGDVAAEVVVSAPGWSLYCLDFATDQAMFTELPQDTDMSAAPFVYSIQFECAARAIVMPLAEMVELSRTVAAPSGLAFLFSTGRCGSTLASRMLAEIPGVACLSEPDGFTNLALARMTLAPDRAAELAAAVTRLAGLSVGGRAPDALVIKPRSEAVVHAVHYVDAFPEAKAVFLYRDAVGYVNSLYRFAQRALGEDMFFNSPDSQKISWLLSSINGSVDLLDAYFPDDRAEVGHLEYMALGWVLRMDAYRAAEGTGGRLVPLHYDDLNRDRRGGTEALLAGCGISPVHVDLAMQAFARDAHAGGAGENSVPARPLDAGQRARVSALLERWDRPDYVEARLQAPQ